MTDRYEQVAREIVDILSSKTKEVFYVGLITAKLRAAFPEPAPTTIEVYPIRLNERQRKTIADWAADDRLWTTQETATINLATFARTILRDAFPEPAPICNTQNSAECNRTYTQSEVDVLLQERDELREQLDHERIVNSELTSERDTARQELAEAVEALHKVTQEYHNWEGGDLYPHEGDVNCCSDQFCRESQAILDKHARGGGE